MQYRSRAYRLCFFVCKGNDFARIEQINITWFFSEDGRFSGVWRAECGEGCKMEDDSIESGRNSPLHPTLI